MFKKNYLVSVTVFLLSLGAVSLFGQTVDNVYIENVRRQADAGNAEMCYQFAHFAKDRFQQSSKA